MIPETGAKKQIMLYKCIDFPKKWEFVKSIKKDIYAPDVSIFIKDEIIYIFTCNNKGDSLKIFYSTDLFENFKEHSINNTSTKYARNAGNIFKLNGEMYRPCQICKPSYGYAIGINKIDDFSETNYSETLIKLINPDWFPQLTGTHTLNICDNLIITDGRLRIKSPNMKKIQTIKGGEVYKSTDNDSYCNLYMNKLLLEYKNIHLTDLPSNIVNKYCKSKKINMIETNHDSIKDDKIIFETVKNYSHYRIIYENNGIIYKLINFYDTCLDIFLSQSKYDKFFTQAIENNFYGDVALVNNYIYDKINKQYIGYCGVKLNEIKKFDENKFNDLIERLVISYKQTGLVFTDLITPKDKQNKPNIMEYNDKYYIIDLESICDKETYIKYKDIRFKLNNKYYENKLGL